MRLPGWRSSLRITPLRHPVDLASSMPLHGALSLVLGQPHASKTPNFLLAPQQVQERPGDPLRGRVFEGLQVHWLHPEAWRLSDSKHRVDLWRALRFVEIGPMAEVVTADPEPGEYGVVLRTLTPVTFTRDQDGGAHAWMSRGLLLGVVMASAARLLGKPAVKALPVEGFRARVTEQRLLRFPAAPGWDALVRGGVEFRAEIECPAAWLGVLRVLEQLGLGRNVSRGFGRFRLSAERLR